MKLNWQKFLTEHYKPHVCAAWMGYCEKGRGLLVLNFNMAQMDQTGNILGLPIEYLTADDPVVMERGGWPVSEAPHAIQKYDPEKQMVVLILGNTEAHVTIMGNFPVKDIYRSELARQAVFGQERGN